MPLNKETTDICPRVDLIVQLESKFTLAFYSVTVQYVNYYAMGTPLIEFDDLREQSEYMSVRYFM